MLCHVDQEAAWNVEESIIHPYAAKFTVQFQKSIGDLHKKKVLMKLLPQARRYMPCSRTLSEDKKFEL